MLSEKILNGGLVYDYVKLTRTVCCLWEMRFGRKIKMVMVIVALAMIAGITITGVCLLQDR